MGSLFSRLSACTCMYESDAYCIPIETNLNSIPSGNFHDA